MRVAIYFTPPTDAPLALAAADWLGRGAFSAETARPLDESRAALVAEPARYGFHATMKAPFHLAAGTSLDALDRALATFCAGRSAPVIAQLALRRLSGFFALVPGETEPALDALAAETVRAFEPFRAPLTEADRARRRPESLSERQRAHLDKWGYPHVFEEFRFHMTLTGRVPDAAAPPIEAELLQRFSSVIGRPLAVDHLALFLQAEAGQPFHVHSLHPLRSEP
jgi:putative phosphonate metabolism protein